MPPLPTTKPAAMRLLASALWPILTCEKASQLPPKGTWVAIAVIFPKKVRAIRALLRYSKGQANALSHTLTGNSFSAR